MKFLGLRVYRSKSVVIINILQIEVMLDQEILYYLLSKFYSLDNTFCLVTICIKQISFIFSLNIYHPFEKIQFFLFRSVLWGSCGLSFFPFVGIVKTTQFLESLCQCVSVSVCMCSFFVYLNPMTVIYSIWTCGHIDNYYISNNRT